MLNAHLRTKIYALRTLECRQTPIIAGVDNNGCCNYYTSKKKRSFTIIQCRRFTTNCFVMVWMLNMCERTYVQRVARGVRQKLCCDILIMNLFWKLAVQTLTRLLMDSGCIFLYRYVISDRSGFWTFMYTKRLFIYCMTGKLKRLKLNITYSLQRIYSRYFIFFLDILQDSLIWFLSIL